jgi:hypothetical protein
MYKVNKEEKRELDRAVTKWEYDLLSQENYNGKETS